MTELKPCPFCGGKAKVCTDVVDTNGGIKQVWAFFVECVQCGETTGITNSPEGPGDMWNWRAERKERVGETGGAA